MQNDPKTCFCKLPKAVEYKQKWRCPNCGQAWYATDGTGQQGPSEGLVWNRAYNPFSTEELNRMAKNAAADEELPPHGHSRRKSSVR